MEPNHNPEPIVSAIGLIFLMLTAGIIGGTINYFIAAKEQFSVAREDSSSNTNEKGSGRKKEKELFHFPHGRIWIVNAVIGIGASLLMPLFLATISSSLVNNLLVNADSSGSVVDAFVFFGFCLLAAISSRTFIQTLSSKVLQEATEAKQEATEAKQEATEAKAEVTEIQNEVTPIIEQATESDDISLDEQQVSTIIETKGLSTDEKAILNTLNHPKYTLRSKSGIARETGFDQDKVSSLLEELVDQTLAAKVQGKKGIRWSITPLGRRFIEDT